MFLLSVFLFSVVTRCIARRLILNEGLKSLSLLGSHFGLVDIPVTYDYVIVGGGTAGLTIANRLSKHNTVAVIEAGGFYELENSNLTEVPANDAYYLGKHPLWNNPLIDWFQYTTPQSGLYNDSVLFSQGRTLGGGTARNFMWYHRSATSAYDKWASITGDQSWKLEKFQAALQSPVQFTPPTEGAYPANLTPTYDKSYYSDEGGPLHVSYPNFQMPSGSYIGAGLTELGLPEVPGMTDGNLLGWTFCGTTINPTTETRDSAETSMLRDALRKNFNLQVYTHTLAKRVLFDREKKATGVEVQVSAYGGGSTSFKIHASNEVIVSAGAFRSPQLLMVSGIGPADQLEALNINVLADCRGVGQNLWDHIWVGVSRELKVLTAAWLGNPDFLAQANTEYISNRTGIDSNPAGTLIAFERLPQGSITTSTRNDLDSTFGGDWPDVEYFSEDAYSGDNDDYLLAAPNLRNYSSVAATLVSPFSRGNVTIQSKDTAIHPVVNPAWLTDPRDMEVFIAAFKRVRQLFDTKAMAPVLIGDEVYPGTNVTTDVEIEDIIRRSVDSVYHPAGTCRMGRTDDEAAVLDSRARVLGVKGLRVVDASAFPVLPPGHPSGTVYGFAEKIAQDILHA